ncbi:MULTISPECIES: class F sortase [unclassified Micromonospora]|uniref:class F sortase n=1 Tax=unclassified Micromonospora TaxID=2617518 RepID=UPI0036344C60
MARRTRADVTTRRKHDRRDRARRGRARAAARLVARGCGRFARAARHAFSASVTTVGPPGHPTTGHPTTGRRVPAGTTGRSGTAAGRWRRATRQGPGYPVLFVATLMVLIVAMLGVERVTGHSLLPDRFIAGLRPPPKGFPVLSASRPVGIASEPIGLDAPVHDVGIAPDGSIGAPDADRAQEAGWYDQGPTPGQYGPAVIVGHVDTRTGPAVFHELKQLRSGDRVEVRRADRSVAIFEVDEVRRYAKARLPVDEVYGDFSRPGLRLITCGGAWVGGETGYADNVVVYASLVKARPD